MGIVCSCFASTLLLAGEIFSTLFLVVGEVGSLLIRGVFALLVGLCDVMAACACCCQVPFAERPDRSGYSYTSLALRSGAPREQHMTDKPKFSAKAFAKPSKKLFARPSSLKKEGSKAKATEEKQDGISASADTTAVLQEDEHVKPSIELDAAKEHGAPPNARPGWFSEWFSNATSTPTPAAAPAAST